MIFFKFFDIKLFAIYYYIYKKQYFYYRFSKQKIKKNSSYKKIKYVYKLIIKFFYLINFLYSKSK